MKTNAYPLPRAGLKLRYLAGGIAFVAFVLGAQGLTDVIERHTDASLRETADRADYRQWATAACTPADASQTAIIKRDGPHLRCRIYTRADYGMAPQLVSVAVLEPPL